MCGCQESFAHFFFNPCLCCSVVHAILALFEFIETVQLAQRGLMWPPTIYGAVWDVNARFWYQFACGYYVWDLIMSIYTNYGKAFILHGLLSFPIFGLAAIGPRQFLAGFYGRYYHGVFSLSTPWLHIRELLIAAGKADSPFKFICEGLFALSFILTRVVFGTLVSIRFVYEMGSILMAGQAHSVFAFVIGIVSCSVITCLQLYWFQSEVLPALKAYLSGKEPPKQKLG